MDQKKIRQYYEAYADMIYRLGFTFMKNKIEAEDVVQEVFLRLVRQKRIFESDEHVKAWLIVTTSNYCKSLLSHWWNKRAEIDEQEIALEKQDNNIELIEIRDALLTLPAKIKTACYLYYYEGYNSNEISRMLRKPAGTIRSYLHQGRQILKNYLQEGDII